MIIKDLIEIDFDIENDFKDIENITREVFQNENTNNDFSVQLNSSKTAISAQIWYETHYKESLKNRGEFTIKLLNEYKKHPTIVLKRGASKSSKQKQDDEE
ncbi:hypothetical protein [Candidatus Sulfurimonas baltica]|uniref:Uncharacterized protein n=1 Tax=Candidatus Sulfurimonas baltica TaxID=2740404 RepID=A0A7S7RM91_9BACT|nr:hypothetical protein [Candidatus Sulfurimonas baltica]QOY51329.1 hypothetical protein HUE88_09365 [Candidatus Sulfurimonas baltica]